MKKRMQTLVIPYLFFETAGVLYQRFVLHTVTIPEGLLRMVTLECNVGDDWFLPAMFFAGILMFAYAKYLSDRKPLRIIGTLFGAACFFASWAIPGGIAGNTAIRSLLGFGFMLTGYLLKKQLESVSAANAAAAFVLSVVLALLAYRFAHNDFYDAVVSIPPLFFASGVIGTYFTIGVARAIRWRPLAWLGENSLVIMGTHQLVLYTAKASTSILWVAGLLAGIAALEIVLILVLNRFCPFLVGKPVRSRT